MAFSEFWWPLELAQNEILAVNATEERLLKAIPKLDESLVTRSVDHISALMSANLHAIIGRDGLPHLCHVFVGWGNCRLGGSDLLSCASAFLQCTPGRPTHIPQCDPEGDFHPWQFFAYALMSGVSPSTSLMPSGPTLEEIAAGSILIPTEDAAELGHLLYALSLFSESMIPAVSIKGVLCNRAEVFRRAVEAHYFGHFNVCRKFHLTEGLCVAASTYPELRVYRSTAQGFLDGQLDMLLILSTILFGVHGTALERHESDFDFPAALSNMRALLALGNYIENHIYYGGHIIELAAIAAIQGYNVSARTRACITYVLNTLSALIIEFGDQLGFTQAFLPLSHFRRAATLWMSYLDGSVKSVSHFSDLAAFTAKLDTSKSQYEYKARPSFILNGAYEIIADLDRMRPLFSNVIGCFCANAPLGFEPRGHYPHFRRLGPMHWPRGLHFEFLDYGDEIGIELHMETDAATDYQQVISDLASESLIAFKDCNVRFDPEWAGCRGRLVILTRSNNPTECAARMSSLIEIARPRIEERFEVVRRGRTGAFVTPEAL